MLCLANRGERTGEIPFSLGAANVQHVGWINNFGGREYVNHKTRLLRWTLRFGEYCCVNDDQWVTSRWVQRSLCAQNKIMVGSES